MHTQRPAALVALHAGFSHSSPALACLAAHCRHEPFYPRLHRLEAVVNGRLDWLLEALVRLRPALAGFSTYLWNIDASLRLARALKQLVPDCMVVLGGPEAGPRAAELLAREAAVDCVVDGEGEEAFRALARRCLLGAGELAAVPNLVRRGPHGPLYGPAHTLAPAAIPSPLAAGLFDPGKPLVYWETTRGCPFRCAFCTSAGERLRARPSAHLEADLALLGGLHEKTVKLLDRSFHLGRGRTLALLERFLATPASLRFHLELNPDRVSPEALDLFRRAPAGKFQFEIGLQSLDPDVLAAVDRHMAVDRALATIGELVAQGRHPVHVDLIAGLPGEDAARCRASLDRTFALFPDHLQLGTLKLLPGTPLRARAAELGYRWDPQPPYEVLEHPHLPFGALMRLKRYAELLDRLWNNGLLPHTLMHLVPTRFDGRVSALFDALLDYSGDALAVERPGPDAVFARCEDFLGDALDHDATLAALFAWDYVAYTLPHSRTPPRLRRLLAASAEVTVDGQRKRLPVVELTQAAASLLARRSTAPVAPGRYALWPRKHRKGRPLEVVAVDPGGTGGA